MATNILKPDSTKKNYVYQFLYQVVTLVLPLAVSPYLTRRLGSNALGTYTYTYSIAFYFALFGMLGINKHGQRIISQRRHDIIKLRSTFWSLYIVHFITAFISLIAYVCYLIFYCNEDQTIALIQAIYVVASLFDLTWVFFGLEKFKIVTTRNLIVKILNAACIFGFVKSKNDIVIYTLIMVGTACAGHIVVVPQVIKSIPPIKPCRSDYKEHVKPLFTLFGAVLAASLYTIFDKTLLGILLSKDDVAFYEYSDKIINIPKNFIAICGTVMFPRACRFAADEDFRGMNSVFKKTIMITSFIGFGAFWGLMAVADQFATLYYGNDFAVCGDIMQMMCPLILIIGIGDALRQIFIFPMKMDMKIVKILFVNAAINLVISISLIPLLGVGGVVLGTIGAELFGLIAEINLTKQWIEIRQIFTTCLAFLIVGIIMFFVIRAMMLFRSGGWGSLLVQIIGGALAYCMCSYAYLYLFDKSSYRSLLNFQKSFFNKLKR